MPKFYLCLFFLLFGFSEVQAQNRLSPQATPESRGNRYGQLLQRLELTGNLPAPFLASEGAVDPNTYIVGPGDQFSITVGGATPVQLVAPVSADGSMNLVIAASFMAAGKTLFEVQETAQEILQDQFRNVEVGIALVQPRQFYVHIAGAVPEPGKYLVLPVSRLDDAIQQAFTSKALARPDPSEDGALRIAGSATSEIPALSSGYHPSMRSVQLTRKDGTTMNLDLFNYYITGDLEQNPYLQDGDVISIAAYHEDRDAIRVSGGVPNPGKIAYRHGDTLLDVLRLASGGSPIDTYGEVRISRRGQERPADVHLYNIQDIVAGTSPAPLLEPGDHVNVVDEQEATAAIYGFVQYPGTYPIESAKTTLRELLDTAGGLKADANPRAAYIERRQSQYLKPDGQSSELDFFGRAYLRETLRENRLVVNIERALDPDSPEVILYSGDVVVFPRDEETVYVTGNVVTPGYIPYEEGRPASYYLEAAGGAAPMTTGIFVFEAGTGEVTANLSTTIRPGDTIFANREASTDNPELQALLIQDQVSKRQTRIATTQTIITGVTALVSVINTFILIRDRTGN